MAQNSKKVFATSDNLPTATDQVWRDDGTGGMDWSLHTCWPTGTAVGWGQLGDVVAKGYSQKNNLQFLGTRIFVNTTLPKTAVKATGFRVLKNFDFGAPLCISVPTHEDADYMAIGHCARYGRNNKPPVGEKGGDYYLIHKRFLLQINDVRSHLNEDGFKVFTPVTGYHMFFYDDARNFILREEQDLMNCCSDSNQGNCGNFTKGSLTCSKYMSEYCSTDDIKFGGSCYDWCSRDPASCDNAKLSFCADHPNDALCSCINATEQPDYIKMVSEHPEIYGMSLPICFYSKCKLQDDKQFYTTDLKELQQSARCAVDLTLIDQAIKVLGDNNVLDTSQTATSVNNKVIDNITTNTAVNDSAAANSSIANETKQASSNTLYYILLAVLLTIIGIIIGFIRYNKVKQKHNTEEYDAENDTDSASEGK